VGNTVKKPIDVKTFRSGVSKKERKKKYKYIFCASEKFLQKKQFFKKGVPITKAN
jgi:hypothetical protein